MRYLLDTNICVLLIRQKSQTVLQRLTQHPIADIVVSAITVAELQYGVCEERAPPPKPKGARLFFAALDDLAL